MKLIAEIFDKDVGEKSIKTEFKRRNAIRAVLKNNDKIAILHVTKLNYHKLPGGGIEKGEEPLKALEREVLEETGCMIKIGKPIGQIIENKSHQGKIQTSTCYYAEVLEEGKPSFTQKEKRQGFKLQWMKHDQAIKLLEQDFPENYMGKFIVKRDLAFLKESKKEQSL